MIPPSHIFSAGQLFHVRKSNPSRTVRLVQVHRAMMDGGREWVVVDTDSGKESLIWESTFRREDQGWEVVTSTPYTQEPT